MNLSGKFNFEVRTDPTMKPSFATGILRGKRIQKQLHLFHWNVMQQLQFCIALEVGKTCLKIDRCLETLLLVNTI